MAEASRMLVVGADPERSRDVVQRLYALCSSGSVDQVKAAPTVQPLTFSTKYYTANVDVHVHQVLENEPVTPLAHEEYEAVVCVIDVTREESFLHVARFLAQMGSETIDVCLLVGHNSAAEKTSAVLQHLERMQEWCLDNEFEFVELVEDAKSSNNQMESGSSGFDEKQGMDRVLEALHCNLWRSMVMQSAEAGGASDDSGLRELSQVSATLSTSNQEEEQRDPKVSPAVAPGTTSAPEDTAEQEEKGGDQLHTLLRALEITEAADKVDLGSAAGASSSQSNNFVNGDDDDDIDMAEFSALISEVRRVRDNGQTMTDEQRRQRAAEVAMKLWNFLGADDESGDDDDDKEA
uniref:Uncharacterized protein n=1 Tax=Globisporangium ultimum (strain ATCC 200006 / CBS 805.95 / DAOM BR144) TaxID=431595 RepID=K3X3M6_GLOUD